MKAFHITIENKEGQVLVDEDRDVIMGVLADTENDDAVTIGYMESDNETVTASLMALLVYIKNTADEISPIVWKILKEMLEDNENDCSEVCRS